MTHEPMKTEDIINALAKPLGAAALNQRGYPADIATVIDKAIKGLNLLNEHRFATNWSLSELRDLFGEYGAPAGDRGAVRPAQFSAWLVGLVRELHNRTVSQHERIVDDREVAGSMRRRLEEAETENRRLRAQLTEQKPADTPAQVVLWNRPEQFGLPPGYTINNPANLSPDQIGEGYRIATTADDTDLPHEFFREEVNQWVAATRTRGTFSGWGFRTYRVPADRPLPPLENYKP